MSSATKPPTRIFGRLRVALKDAAMTITLNNPQRRNAIGPKMVSELLYALEDAHADNDVRAIILTGDGRSFCAGGDFAHMSGQTQSSRDLPLKGDYADLLLAMMRTAKPIIARVNGPALGGGLGLVAASTFAIAHTDAPLGTPEVNVGLFPMMIMAALARQVPRRKLLEMMLFGHKMTADEALALGLLNRVVPAEELDEAVQAVVDEIKEKSPLTIALGLRAFAEQDDLAMTDALPLLRNKLAEILGTEDAQEGLTAFLEKRNPVWKGR